MLHLTLIKYKINNKQKEFRLIKEIQHQWENMGTLLGVSVNRFASHEKPEDKCRSVLDAWLKKGSEQYPVKWDSVIKVLQDLQLNEVADVLRKALDNIVE